MKPLVMDDNDPIIHYSMINNMRDYHRHLNQNPENNIIELNGQIVIKSEFELLDFNTIILNTVEELEQELPILEKYFDDLNSPYQLIIHPEINNDKLRPKLKDYSYRYIGDLLGLTINIENLNRKISYPKSLYVEEINNNDRLRKWIDIVSNKIKFNDAMRQQYYELFENIEFGSSSLNWKKYIGWLNGEPVACCTLILGGGIAMIYDEAILLRLSRNRWGIDDGVLLKALQDALKLGYKVAAVLSSIGEMNKYKKLGFVEKNKIPRYIKIKRNR